MMVQLLHVAGQHHGLGVLLGGLHTGGRAVEVVDQNLLGQQSVTDGLPRHGEDGAEQQLETTMIS